MDTSLTEIYKLVKEIQEELHRVVEELEKQKVDIVEIPVIKNFSRLTGEELEEPIKYITCNLKNKDT